MLPRIMVYMAEQSATQQQRQPHITVETRAMWQSTTKALEGKKQKRSNQEGYCWSSSTRMGATAPGSLLRTPKRDSWAL